MKKIMLLAVILLSVIACDFDEDANKNAATPDTFGAANLTFNNTMNGANISLNTTAYTNFANEVFKISELKYIISNVSLVRENGSKFSLPESESYFLINQANGNKTISIPNVPIGTYSGLEIGFGVDQSKYPLNGMANFVPQAEEAGMLWSWSAGYKFLKFEGTYTTPSITDEKTFLVHVGSHGDVLDNYRKIELPLNNFTVSNEATTNATVNVEFNQLFNGTTDYKFEDKNEIMVDPTFAPIITNNITTAFSIQ